MDLEYENLNSHNNQEYYSPAYNTPTSSTSSSSSTSSALSNFCTPSNRKSSLFDRISNMNNNYQQQSNFNNNNNNNNILNNTSSYINGNTSTMSSSSSQIFATAASFNISQNDTVFYSRETIHLLVKFLSNHSENPIFRSLYSFAPDNLAWLWAFFDWETPLNLDYIDSQDTFVPLKVSDDPTGSFNEDTMKLINKIFADSPLFQYKYRDNIMIADVYKFIEHVQKINVAPVAKALFSLYFPRLASYIENPLKGLAICPKILKTNLSRIKLVDDIVKSLVKSRYSDLNEYKQKLIGNMSLPTYVRSLLNENHFWSPNSKLLQQLILTINLNTNNNINDNSNNNTNNNVSPKSSTSSVASNSDKMLANNYFQFNTTSNKTTNDYLKLLHNNTRINNDLDSSFDNLNRQVTLAKEEEDDENELDDQDVNNELNDLATVTTSATLINSNSDDKSSQESVFNSSNNLADLADNFTGKSAKLNTAAALANYYLNTIQQNQQQTNSDVMLNDLASPRLNINSMEQLEDVRLTVGVNHSSIGSNSNLNSPSALSPIPNRQATKLMLNTPKTPSNLSQYMSMQSTAYGSNTTLTNDQSIWNNKLLRSSMMTPPPSATPIKSPGASSSRLNAITNGLSAFDLVDSNDNNDSIIASPVPSQNNRTFNLMDPLAINPSNDESFYKYLKHSALISSPVPRFNQNKFQTDYSSSNQTKNPFSNSSGKFNNYSNKFSLANNNSNRTNSGNDYASFLNYNQQQQQQFQSQQQSSYHSHRHNSNVELNFPSNKLSANRNNYSANDVNNETFFNNNNSSLCRSPVQSNISLLLSQQSQAITNYFSNGNGSTHQIWQGRLPPKIYADNALYSRKVFLGGLPWDVNQQSLLQSLHRYGTVKLEIPGKDAKHPRVSSMCKTQERSTPGYVYIIYDNESSVQKLLADCRKEYKNGGEHYYYSILIPQNNQNSSMNYQFNNQKRCKAKEVEVIPWNQEDTSYVPQNKTSMLPAKIDAKSTIFVGALHGMLNAQGLAKVMNEVFGEVIHAGLDTDKYKYPIGSGRVTFRNRQSYVKAIKSKYVSIKANLDPTDPSPKFEKTIQIDPYLEDAKCCKCENKSYYFCRNENCLDYYCMNCWQYRHDTKNNGEHQSISRQNKQNYC
jgi:cytoplasmic polyadenylation element-binding protein